MDRKVFETIAKMSQRQLTLSLAKVLYDNYGKENVINVNGNLFAKGTCPIILVAHLDTVFKTLPTEIYFDSEQQTMWSPQGLGADDRAGVYAILRIIGSTKPKYRPSVMFCQDEEVGCQGAIEFVTAYPKCPVDAKYIIEIDRRGSNDCVFYDTDNPKFIEYIESFGFELAQGTYSDILEICTTWKIPGTNLSSGYYNEHFSSEFLKANELDATIGKIRKMVAEKNIPDFEYIPKMSRNFCHFCHSPLTMYEDYMIRTEHKAHPYIHVCPSCLGNEEDVKWCSVCQTPYIGKNDKFCPKCAEELSK